MHPALVGVEMASVAVVHPVLACTAPVLLVAVVQRHKGSASGDVGCVTQFAPAIPDCNVESPYDNNI